MLTRFSVVLLTALLAIEVATGQQEESPSLGFSELSERSIGEVMRRTGMSVDELLFLAAERATDPDVIGKLVSLGADIEAKQAHCVEVGFYNCFLISPLYMAAGYNPDPSITEALLLHGAEIDEVTGSGYQPIHMAAAFNGNPSVMDVFISNGISIETESLSGETPLHMAAHSNGLAMVEHLVPSGADAMAVIDGHNYRGSLPIHHAARNDDPTVLEYFIGLGQDINSVNGWDETPLYIAVNNKKHNNMTLLLGHGADVNIGIPAIRAAAFRHYELDFIKLLMDHGADLNDNSGGITPLGSALLTETEPSYIRGLLELGADPSIEPSPMPYVHAQDDCEGFLRLIQEYRDASYPFQEFLWCTAHPAFVEFRRHIRS